MQWQQETAPEPASRSGRCPQECTSLPGKTIRFDTLEIHANATSSTRLTLMEADLLRYLLEPRRSGWYRARRFSKKCGACAKTRTRAPSITSSSGCGATWKTIPAKPKHLLTVRGVGYRFRHRLNASPEKAEAFSPLKERWDVGASTSARNGFPVGVLIRRLKPAAFSISPGWTAQLPGSSWIAAHGSTERYTSSVRRC